MGPLQFSLAVSSKLVHAGTRVAAFYFLSLQCGDRLSIHLVTIKRDLVQQCLASLSMPSKLVHAAARIAAFYFLSLQCGGKLSRHLVTIKRDSVQQCLARLSKKKGRGKTKDADVGKLTDSSTKFGPVTRSQIHLNKSLEFSQVREQSSKRKWLYQGRRVSCGPRN